MKTLDEVVEMAEHCWKPMPEGTCNNCPSRERAGNCKILAQALYYLKEYKSGKDELDRTRLAYLDILTDYVALKNNWAEQQANPALSWNELKQMEGKPVWIEHLETETPHGEWTIVQTPAAFGDVYVVTRCRDRYVLYEEDLGKTWQAYRKERTE